MRHLKVEFYLVTQQVVACILPICIGFADKITWIDVDKFGPRDFAQSQIFVIIALLPRVSLLLSTLYAALSGKNFNDPFMKRIRICNIIFAALTLVVMLIYRYAWLEKDIFEAQNAFIVIWFDFEIIGKAFEIVWYTIHALQTMIPQDSSLAWIAKVLGGGQSKEVEDTEKMFAEKVQ